MGYRGVGYRGEASGVGARRMRTPRFGAKG